MHCGLRNLTNDSSTHASSGRTLPSSILLLGATGLVGSHCLRLLAGDPGFHRVVVLTRRPLPIEQRAANIEPHVVDFDNLTDHAALFRVDRILCALGTTIRKAGSQARFRVVDHDYPLAAARIGLTQGVTHYLLVSSIGADVESRAFYTRVKGELESALLALGYRSVTIVRPSLLLGPRTEHRLGEQVAKRLAFLMPTKYKPVHAHAVAAALVRAAKEDRPGAQIIESRDIHKTAAGDEPR